ncbi:hypothetical protein [Catellatospora sp. NPDC049609]|uniref:hypothetical protein n=1 Tax=Catellatospora sp. NPDC049609 TaxID=3155505 RepID=UPI00343E8065
MSSSLTERLRSRPALLRLVLLLAGAWALPAATHALGADWLLPIVIFLGTAALCLDARELLDRLVLAAVLLAGLAGGATTVWSLWPWGLHPVPIAGTALSALVVFWFVTGRRPSLPRPRWTDVFALGVIAAATVVAALPYFRASGDVALLSVWMQGEDASRHFALFDAIGHVQGLALADKPEAAAYVPRTLFTYPQGWHTTAAVLDQFLRSADGPAASGFVAMRSYLLFSVLTFGLLAATLVWGAWRLPGRLLDGPRRVVVAVAVAALVVGAEFPRFLRNGYPAECLGLVFLAALVVLAARPLASFRQQALLVAATLIGLGFAYFFLLPLAGMIALAWLIRSWRQVRAHRVATAVIGLGTVVLAPFQLLYGLSYENMTDRLIAGGLQPQPVDGYVWLVALVGAGVLSAAGLRSRAWRVYLLGIGLAVVFAVGIAVQNIAAGDDFMTYYFGKTVHALLVVFTVGIGAVVLLLPAPWRLRVPVRRRVLPAALLSVAVLGVFGALFGGGALQQPLETGRASLTWARLYRDAPVVSPRAEQVYAAAQAYPALPGVTSVAIGATGFDSYWMNPFLMGLQRTAGADYRATYGLPHQEPARATAVLERFPGRVRFIATDPEGARVIRELLTRRPELAERVTLVTVPGVD